ncbi:hypothetical protein TUM20983_02110 [Mycobacterium antarcticum]|nr:hypothetical protein TUM20983_02110 [Mycolicibacterium sp. TUM20983]
MNLAGPRDAERIGLAVEVEARHLGQAHPRVETLGIGLAGEDLDVVAKLYETATQMADVDALPTTMRLASV